MHSVLFVGFSFCLCCCFPSISNGQFFACSVQRTSCPMNLRLFSPHRYVIRPPKSLPVILTPNPSPNMARHSICPEEIVRLSSEASSDGERSHVTQLRGHYAGMPVSPQEPLSSRDQFPNRGTSRKLTAGNLRHFSVELSRMTADAEADHFERFGRSDVRRESCV